MDIGLSFLKHRAKQLKPALLMGMAVAVVVGVSSHYLRVDLSSSMPAGVLIVSDERPQVGDEVEFCLPAHALEFAKPLLPKGSCPGGVVPLHKRLVAVGAAPDLPPGKPKDRLGRLLPEPDLTQRGCWVLGESPDSFDSRYFGAVPCDRLKRLKRVWTFSPAWGKHQQS